MEVTALIVMVGAIVILSVTIWLSMQPPLAPDDDEDAPDHLKHSGWEVARKPQDAPEPPPAPTPAPVVLEPAQPRPLFCSAVLQTADIPKTPQVMDFWEVRAWADHEGFQFSRWSDLERLNDQRVKLGYPMIVRRKP